MLVARSFSYQSRSRSPPNNSPREEKDAPSRTSNQSKPLRGQPKVRGFGWRPDSFPRPPPQNSPADPELSHDDNSTAFDGHIRWAGEAGTANNSRNPEDGRTSSERRDELPHSDPVAVPSRKARGYSSNSVNSDNVSSGSTSRSGNSGSGSMPRSVAKMLANTSIPMRKTFPKQRPRAEMRRISIDELVESWKTPPQGSPSLSSSPAMSVLLSSPDDLDDVSVTDDGLNEDEDAASIQFSTSRSASSDSVPSLEMDDRSSLSFSVPTTPEMAIRRKQLSLRDRGFSLPKNMESAKDHPLLQQPAKDQETAVDEDPLPEHEIGRKRPVKPARQRRSQPRSVPSNSALAGANEPEPSRKSSLTESLKGPLRSLGRSFSNFAVSASTSMPPTDHVSRGLGLFPPGSGPPAYNPEMRPRVEGTPSPQLRRYLNPHAIHLESDHQEAGYSHRLPDELEHDDEAMSIQMESFPSGYHSDGRVKRSDGALSTSSPALPEAGHTPSLQQQRREPRENPEFLRICVLQLAMRKAGKIEGAPFGSGSSSEGEGQDPTIAMIQATVQGGTIRRGWWLPPRVSSSVTAVSNGSEDDGRSGGHRKAVPRRWMPIQNLDEE